MPVTRVTAGGAGSPGGPPPADRARWDLALDGVTGPDAGLVRLWLDGDRVLVAFRERLEAAWLTIASPYHVGLRAATVTRAWPWQSLANCQNIGGKIVCTR